MVNPPCRWTGETATGYADFYRASAEARVAQEPFALRLAAALKTLTVALALSWAPGAWAVLAGTADNASPGGGPIVAAATLPSIEILPQQTSLAGTCGGAPFDITTFINVDTQASADVRLSASDVGTIEQFTDDTGTNIGPFKGIYPKFHILGFGGGLAPNTPILLTITTYTGHSLSGDVSYVTSALFNCTNGTILNLSAGAPGAVAPIPALGDVALAAMAGLLALLGMLSLRRRAGQR